MPLLLTVEPRSLARLTIEVVEPREAQTWKQHGDTVAAMGLIEPHTVVSDQGSGVVQGWALRGLRPHPEVWHRQRTQAMVGDRCSRTALAAIARAYARGSVEVGRSAAGITKRSAAYEAATAEADAQIVREDHGCSLGTALRRARDVCDDRGARTERTSRQAERAAIVTWMDTREGAPLHQARVSFASGFQGSWGSYPGVEQVSQPDSTRAPRAVGQALACGWPWERHATTTTASGTRKRLAQEAQGACSSAATLVPEAAAAIRKEWLEALETEGRSASLIEPVHSA